MAPIEFMFIDFNVRYINFYTINLLMCDSMYFFDSQSRDLIYRMDSVKRDQVIDYSTASGRIQMFIFLILRLQTQNVRCVQKI